MENKLTLHLKMFNDKVRLMNQLNQKSITLSASEARSLHSDIFDLLSQISFLAKSVDGNNDSDNLLLDGGKFK